MATKIAELFAEFTTRGLTSVQGKMKGLKKGMESANASMQQVSRVAKRVFIAVGGVMAVAARQAIKFQEQMAMVSTMLSDNTMPMMVDFTRGVRELAVEFGESTQALSKGLFDILSASIAPAKALEVLRVAAQSATAGLTTTAVSADAITTILNSYGMAAESAAQVSDQLFATVKRGKLTYDELAGSIGKASATAAVAGLSLNELLAAISTITRAGISTDQAMTAVVGTIQSFLKPADQSKKLAKELGFELSTATLKAEGLSGVFAKLNGLQAEQLAILFPNIRGLKGVAAAMQDLTGFATDLDLQMNSAGLTQEAFGKRAATVAFQLKQLKANFNDVFISLGNALLPAIKSAVKFLGNLASAIRNNSGAVLKFLKTLAGWALKLMAVAAAIKIVGAAMTLLTLNPLGAFIVIMAIVIAATIDWEAALARLTKSISQAVEESAELSHLNKQSISEIKERAAGIRSGISEFDALIKTEKKTQEQEIALFEIRAKLIAQAPSLEKVLDGLADGTLKLADAIELLNAKELKLLKNQTKKNIRKTERDIRVETSTLEKQQARRDSAFDRKDLSPEARQELFAQSNLNIHESKKTIKDLNLELIRLKKLQEDIGKIKPPEKILPQEDQLAKEMADVKKKFDKEEAKIRAAVEKKLNRDVSKTNSQQEAGIVIKISEEELEKQLNQLNNKRMQAEEDVLKRKKAAEAEANKGQLAKAATLVHNINNTRISILMEGLAEINALEIEAMRHLADTFVGTEQEKMLKAEQIRLQFIQKREAFEKAAAEKKAREDEAILDKAERHRDKRVRKERRKELGVLGTQASALGELRRRTIRDLPEEERKKIEAEDFRKAMEKQLGPKLYQKNKAAIDEQIKKIKAPKRPSAGQFEGFTGIFKRLQSAAVQTPEVKELKKTNGLLDGIKGYVKIVADRIDELGLLVE